MDFSKQPLTRALARSLRAGTRGIEFNGHGFRYSDLKELWATPDDMHAVLTHDEDKTWQYWFHGAHGWALVGVYPSRLDAQAAAGQEQIKAEDDLEPGTYVMARWDANGRWMRVRSSSDRITENLSDIFKSLGCETRVEDVDA